MGLPGSGVWGWAVESACGQRGACRGGAGARFGAGVLMRRVSQVMALRA